MSELVANLVVGGAVLLAGGSLLMTGVAFLSWRRVRAGRLAWIALAFLFEAAAGVYLSLQAFQDRMQLAESGPGLLGAVVAFDLVVVLCLYLAVVKR